MMKPQEILSQLGLPKKPDFIGAILGFDKEEVRDAIKRIKEQLGLYTEEIPALLLMRVLQGVGSERLHGKLENLAHVPKRLEHLEDQLAFCTSELEALRKRLDTLETSAPAQAPLVAPGYDDTRVKEDIRALQARITSLEKPKRPSTEKRA